jgi:rod shape determining protein RodA
MDRLSATWRHFDFWLLGAVALLCIFGIIMIRSTVAGNIELTEAAIVQRQIIFVTLGLGVIFLVASIDYHFWSSTSRLMYLAMMGILILLFVVGTAFYGSARWFETSYFFIQPSEPAKIILILVLADFFTRSQPVHDLRWIGRICSSQWVLSSGSSFSPTKHHHRNAGFVVYPSVDLWIAIQTPGGFAAAGVVLPVLGFPLLQEYQQQRVLSSCSGSQRPLW